MQGLFDAGHIERAPKLSLRWYFFLHVVYTITPSPKGSMFIILFYAE